MSNQQDYTMSINFNVLNHLGINLYSNTPAVLSEVVANAWDADAENVIISIDKKNDTITISDDGHGMSVEDANAKFLTVGYQRRENGECFSPVHNRPVMGRKGIGKLSLLSIAKNIKIYSIKDGSKHGFELKLDEIEALIKNKNTNESYHPNKLNNIPKDLTKGTRIVISNFKKKIAQTDSHLKKRLARRFSVIGSTNNFNIIIDNQEITIHDRDYYNKVQFLWEYGNNTPTYKELCINNHNSENRTNMVDNSNYSIEGWIGTTHTSGDLTDKQTKDNLNKIVIMVRGKVAQEDILEQFSEGGVYSKYIFGEIHADFLDEDNQEDIATSSRQKILEDDERYLKLKGFIHNELKHIQRQWTKLRNEEGTKETLEDPKIQRWYDKLGSDNKKQAKKLFGKIHQLAIDSDNDKKMLLKHGILAFENLRIKNNLSSLEELDGQEFEKFISIFNDIDNVEASMYHDIVKSRLEVIKKLKSQVSNNDLEKILQEHIFTHLWLLDPSWERASGSQYMEESVITAFKGIDDTLTATERKGRVDIRYKTLANKHCIIELKRAERSISSTDLIKQCSKYTKALKKCLKETGITNEPIEVISVIGKKLSDYDGDPDTEEEITKSLAARNIRVVTYQKLLHSAYSNYDEFLQRNQEVEEIKELINSL